MDVNKYEISVMHLTKNMVEDVQLFMNEHEIDPEKDITDSILRELYVPGYPADFIIIHTIGFMNSLLSLENHDDSDEHKHNVGIK